MDRQDSSTSLLRQVQSKVCRCGRFLKACFNCLCCICCICWTRWKGWRCRTKDAQLLIPEQVSMEFTRGFADSFTRELKGHLVRINRVNTVSELNTDIPLIVACPSGSRLEPSIDHAFENFSWQVPFITVILNSGTKDSLPEEPSATRLPVKETYMNAEFIDVAYNHYEKLYPCAMNKTALDRIKTFVENFRTKKDH